MTKFLAVVKREYVQKVRTKLFVIMTVIGPILLLVFTVIPGLIMSIKTGGDTRIAVIDQTDGAKLFESVRESLMRRDRSNDQSAQSNVTNAVNSNSQERMKKAARSLTGNFLIEPVNLKERSLDDVRRELGGKVARDQLDGYLIIPADILTNTDSNPVYYGRNTSDPITREQIEKGISTAVRRQRLLAANVKEVTDENRISAMRVSFSSTMAPRITWPYKRTVI